MKEYSIEINILPGSNITTIAQGSSGSTNDLNHTDTLGFRGLFLADGDEDNNSGSWLDGSFQLCDDNETYDGFMGTELSSAEKTFAIPQRIKVSTSAARLTNIIIYFDSIAEEYATEIDINGTTYNNSSYIFITELNNVDKNATITFTKWNKANSLVKVRGVKFGLTLKYDENQYTDLEYSNDMLSGNDLVSFGIINQSGSVKISDDGMLKQINESGFLETGANVKIYKNDTLIQQFITVDYDEKDLSGLWELSLSDDLTNWENEQFEGLNYKQRTLKNILDYLIPGLVYDNIDLSKIVIPNSYMRVSNKWQAIVKCCNIGMIRIYKINGIIHARSVL